MSTRQQSSRDLPRELSSCYEASRMRRGLYEQLLTHRLARQLQALDPGLLVTRRDLESSESPEVMTQHLAAAILRTLESLKPEQRVEAANRVISALVGEGKGAVDLGDAVDEKLQQLLSILPAGPVALPEVPRPAVPLNNSDLLVHARGEHRIGAELVKELASADQVDVLCSFLKWTGFRVLRDGLEQFVDRGGRLRILTTCYMGATEVRVLEALGKLGEVKVSYDSRRTRLHAKAWLFYRDTGYSTAYIGSSNMSSAALQDGLEWNVRISRAENPRILTKFQGAFESYWQDGEFEVYVPGRDCERFLQAVREESSSPHPSTSYTLDVKPYPFQMEILQRLETERHVHGRWRNLVVAATGTGKTVMAGLDYRRLFGGRARLLFVAHRDEILEQSLVTFRAILKDGSFGDKWTGRVTPGQQDHLFASVQKLANVDLSTIPADHFDVVIVDEFHHAAAPTYTRLLQHFRPRLLLGLTATPERADGKSVLEWFDGSAAVELRIWDALERGLLCPFQYFGSHDNTNLSGVAFERGRYDQAQLENLYTGNDARVRLILEQIAKHVADPSRMRAIGFCVGVDHAKFMARRFCEAGYQATVVLGETPERQQAIAQLRAGSLQVVFTVDVFNEGVDLPEVDTLLLLRPTESATIFLQQLGRGLRLHDSKECLTVLDFLGVARQEFRFDIGFRALLGGTRKELAEQVETGFPYLPSGCSMQLDRMAAKVVLDNLKGSIKRARPFLRQELISLGPQASLAEFLARSGAELEEVYSGKEPGWIGLRRQVGFPTPPASATETPLLKAVARLLHGDAMEQLDFTSALVARESPPAYGSFGEREKRRLAMLHFSLFSTEAAARPIDEGLKNLWEEGTALEELRALLPVLRERVDHQDHPLPEHPDVPLRVHCHYSLAEILAGFAVMTPDRPHRIREGVYYHEPSGCDLFFITVRKNERDYSPSTLYRDFAISPQLFHWESQSTTRADSPTGLRYRSHTGRTHVLLFVRESAKDERGQTRPYLFLGPAHYLSHEGERPMAITWRLKHDIPFQFFRGMRLAS